MKKDLTNQQFNKLIALKYCEGGYWECQCECGNKTKVKTYKLKSGHTKSCGCLPKFGRRRDDSVIGKTYNNLTVLSFSHSNGHHNFYICKCKCGNIKPVDINNLKNGNLQSCGCARFNFQKNRGYVGYKDICQSTYTAIKHNAKRRNIQFNISIEDIWSIWIKQSGICALTGRKLELARTATQLSNGQQTASLDRIDSNGIYSIDNIQWIHKDLQPMKMSIPQEDFINLCNLVAKIHPRKNFEVVYIGGNKC